MTVNSKVIFLFLMALMSGNNRPRVSKMLNKNIRKVAFQSSFKKDNQGFMKIPN